MVGEWTATSSDPQMREYDVSEGPEILHRVWLEKNLEKWVLSQESSETLVMNLGLILRAVGAIEGFQQRGNDIRFACYKNHTCKQNKTKHHSTKMF